MADPLATIRAYHARTQHHLQRFAASLGYLDWATQPDPFRRYAGAERRLLPLQGPAGRPRYAELFAGALPPAPLDERALGQLFQDSLSLTAAKEYRGSRWFLRANPSSGNLHPTEAYLLADEVPGLGAGPALCHYAPDEHALELRRPLPPALWQRLRAPLPADALLVGLTTIAWRQAWKYGERALRYCMLDAGHAVGALGFAAAALGLRARLLPVADDPLAALLAVEDQSGPEREHAVALLVVQGAAAAGASLRAFALDDAAAASLARLPRHGRPNPLSADHHPWPVIDEALQATRLSLPAPDAWWDGPAEPAPPAAGRAPLPDADARLLFRQRRSAVAMDGRTGLGAAAWFSMLARAADPAAPPLAPLCWRPRVHLLLFVHRVDGVAPGLYVLLRGGRTQAWLRERLRRAFAFEPVPGAPADLPLLLLLPGDCREAARTLSCHQQIAADSAFAAAMLAEFAPTLATFGACGWRLLHFEAGALGQLLYLEAEAVGRRATGIGCFFDPSVHELLGLADDDLRAVYHFTAGGAVDDPRLRTGPPYARESRSDA